MLDVEDIVGNKLELFDAGFGVGNGGVEEFDTEGVVGSKLELFDTGVKVGIVFEERLEEFDPEDKVKDELELFATGVGEAVTEEARLEEFDVDDIIENKLELFTIGVGYVVTEEKPEEFGAEDPMLDAGVEVLEPADVDASELGLEDTLMLLPTLKEEDEIMEREELELVTLELSDAWDEEVVVGLNEDVKEEELGFLTVEASDTWDGGIAVSLDAAIYTEGLGFLTLALSVAEDFGVGEIVSLGILVAEESDELESVGALLPAVHHWLESKGSEIRSLGVRDSPHIGRRVRSGG